MRQFVLAVVCVVAAASPAAAQPGTLVGQWDLSVVAPEAVYPAVLTVKEDGEKLAGTIKGGPGEYPISGTHTADGLTISFTIQRDAGPMVITLKGTQTGDALKGTASFGSDAEGTWTGKRAAAGSNGAAPANGGARGAAAASGDMSGAWALEVATGAGSATPSVTLRQDGDVLSGTYAGQFGEAPAKGRVTGQDFEFAVDIDIQGTPLHIVYTGTRSGDALSGTVAFGDMGQGSFKGTRKKP